MEDPKIAWSELNSTHIIDSFQTESYVQIALNKWLASRSSVDPDLHRVLKRLADELVKNHNDSWLRDFLNARQSMRGNKLLQTAIQYNRKGDYHTAYLVARLAAHKFSEMGNQAGAMRSRFEQIVSLRRRSMNKQCLAEIYRIRGKRERHTYLWFHIQTDIEESVCRGRLGAFEEARALADTAVNEATSAHYTSLALRAVALIAAWHMVEGRLSDTWQTDEGGLQSFWYGTFPAERAFQHYSDLELAAEQAEMWPLAVILQGEVLSMLRQTDLTDFQALAHFKLGEAQEIAGDTQSARQQFQEAYSLFRQFESSPADLATCEIALARIESREGALAAAQKRLTRLQPTVNKVANFTETLPYYETWALVERGEGKTDREAHYLKKALQIAGSGFHSLRSAQERWQWDHLVGPIYRRLFEIEVQQPHNTLKVLTDWEIYYARQTSGNLTSPRSVHLQINRILRRNAHRLSGSTVLAFAVFSDSIVSWVADGRRTLEFRLPVNSKAIEDEVFLFNHLCSDPASSVEKVKESGSRLYNWLIAPLEHKFGIGQTLFIQADSFLSFVPWSALVNRSGIYLGESHNIAMWPTVVSRRKGANRHPTAEILLAYPGAVSFQQTYYPPLPDAEREIEYLSRLFKEVVQLSGVQVVDQRLRSELSNSTIFHFAGHAVSHIYGGELLVHGRDTDTVLSAAALRDLTLTRVKLVFLSACSTATSSRRNGDPHGLIRAFIEAGASNVVATRWETDSHAALLFVQKFYAQYRKNSDTGEAILAAANSLRSGGLSHPFYWAGFQLFESVNEERRNTQ